MLRIAEKLEFLKQPAVKVCTKAGIGSSPESKNPGFRVNLQKTATENENHDSSHRFL